MPSLLSLLSWLRERFGTARQSQAVALDVLPGHESGMRRLMAEAQGGEYVAFPSLADARLAQDVTVVMEGDYGGQMYGWSRGR